jgi:hypothetical protein
MLDYFQAKGGFCIVSLSQYFVALVTVPLQVRRWMALGMSFIDESLLATTDALSMKFQTREDSRS